MPPYRPLLALHCAVLLFGFAGMFGKWLTLAPTAIVFGRTAVAAAVLATIMVLGRRSPERLTWSLAGNGALLAVHWVTFFAAIKVSSVAIGLLGFASFPLFVLLLERFFWHRRWRAGEVLTAALATSGLALLIPEFTLANQTVQGLLWGIASGFTFALLAVRNRVLMVTGNAMSIALWQNAVAALLLSPFVWSGATAAQWTVTTLVLIVILGAVCTAIAHTLFIGSLAHLSAHTASVVAALEPVYGIVFAAMLLAEIPDLRTCIGATLIVGAALVASRSARTVAVPE